MSEIKKYKSGAWASFEKANGWYIARLYDPAGKLLDKMRCDTYGAGREYFRAFCKIAKNHA